MEGKTGQEGEKRRTDAHVGAESQLAAVDILLQHKDVREESRVLCISEAKSALVMMDCICSPAQRTFNPTLRSHAGRLRQMKINYRRLLLSQSFIYSVRC